MNAQKVRIFDKETGTNIIQLVISVVNKALRTGPGIMWRKYISQKKKCWRDSPLQKKDTLQ